MFFVFSVATRTTSTLEKTSRRAAGSTSPACSSWSMRAESAEKKTSGGRARLDLTREVAGGAEADGDVIPGALLERLAEIP